MAIIGKPTNRYAVLAPDSSDSDEQTPADSSPCVTPVSRSEDALRNQKFSRRAALIDSHFQHLGAFDFLGVDFHVVGLLRELGYDKPYNRTEQHGDREFQRLEDYRVRVEAAPRGTQKLGTSGTFLQIVKSFVGIGVLTLPQALKFAGIFNGTLCLVVIAWITHYCMQLLLRASKNLITHNPDISVASMSYPQLAYQILGTFGKRTVDACLIGSQFGFCVSYLIFIANTITTVISEETDENLSLNKSHITFITCLVIVPFNLVKLEFLVIPVLLANVALFAGIFLVYYYSSFQLIERLGKPESEGLYWFTALDLAHFFGIAIYSFEGVGLVLPLQEAMSNPDDLPWILRYAVMALTFIFLTFGMLAYGAFGEETLPTITDNIQKNHLTSFFKLFYSLGIMFTYPLMMSPVFQVCETLLKRFIDPSTRQGVLRSVALRTIIIFLTGVIAIYTQQIDKVIAFVGAVFCNVLAFVIPPAIHLKRPDRQDASRFGDSLDCLCLVWGIVVGIWTTTEAVKNLMDTSEGG